MFSLPPEDLLVTKHLISLDCMMRLPPPGTPIAAAASGSDGSSEEEARGPLFSIQRRLCRLGRYFRRASGGNGGARATEWFLKLLAIPTPAQQAASELPMGTIPAPLLAAEQEHFHRYFNAFYRQTLSDLERQCQNATNSRVDSRALLNAPHMNVMTNPFKLVVQLSRPEFTLISNLWRQQRAPTREGAGADCIHTSRQADMPLIFFIVYDGTAGPYCSYVSTDRDALPPLRTFSNAVMGLAPPLDIGRHCATTGATGVHGRASAALYGAMDYEETRIGAAADGVADCRHYTAEDMSVRRVMAAILQDFYRGRGSHADNSGRSSQAPVDAVFEFPLWNYGPAAREECNLGDQISPNGPPIGHFSYHYRYIPGQESHASGLHKEGKGYFIHLAEARHQYHYHFMFIAPSRRCYRRYSAEFYRLAESSIKLCQKPRTSLQIITRAACCQSKRVSYGGPHARGPIQPFFSPHMLPAVAAADYLYSNRNLALLPARVAGRTLAYHMEYPPHWRLVTHSTLLQVEAAEGRLNSTYLPDNTGLGYYFDPTRMAVEVAPPLAQLVHYYSSEELCSNPAFHNPDNLIDFITYLAFSSCIADINVHKIISSIAQSYIGRASGLLDLSYDACESDDGSLSLSLLQPLSGRSEAVLVCLGPCAGLLLKALLSTLEHSTPSSAAKVGGEAVFSLLETFSAVLTEPLLQPDDADKAEGSSDWPQYLGASAQVWRYARGHRAALDAPDAGDDAIILSGELLVVFTPELKFFSGLPGASIDRTYYHHPASLAIVRGYDNGAVQRAREHCDVACRGAFTGSTSMPFTMGYVPPSRIDVITLTLSARRRKLHRSCNNSSLMGVSLGDILRLVESIVVADGVSRADILPRLLLPGLATLPAGYTRAAPSGPEAGIVYVPLYIMGENNVPTGHPPLRPFHQNAFFSTLRLAARLATVPLTTLPVDWIQQYLSLPPGSGQVLEQECPRTPALGELEDEYHYHTLLNKAVFGIYYKRTLRIDEYFLDLGSAQDSNETPGTHYNTSSIINECIARPALARCLGRGDYKQLPVGSTSTGRNLIPMTVITVQRDLPVLRSEPPPEPPKDNPELHDLFHTFYDAADAPPPPGGTKIPNTYNDQDLRPVPPREELRLRQKFSYYNICQYYFSGTKAQLSQLMHQHAASTSSGHGGRGLGIESVGVLHSGSPSIGLAVRWFFGPTPDAEARINRPNGPFNTLFPSLSVAEAEWQYAERFIRCFAVGDSGPTEGARVHRNGVCVLENASKAMMACYV